LPFWRFTTRGKPNTQASRRENQRQSPIKAGKNKGFTIFARVKNNKICLRAAASGEFASFDRAQFSYVNY
jgi:hypothetical protein